MDAQPTPAVDAVVLAGGRAEPGLAKLAGTDCRPLIPFRGRPFLAWVLDALRGCRRIRRIAVVGPEGLRSAAGPADVLVPEQEGIFENLLAGAAALPGAGRLLVTVCDNPLLTSRAFDDFISQCPDADICYPVLTGEAFRRAFPGSDNVLVPLREGRFIGGCCALVKAEALPAAQAAIARVLAARKSYAGMVGLLGPAFIARFLLRRVTVPELERRVSALAGCTFRFVPDCDPVLPIDIDEAADLARVNGSVGERVNG